MKNPEVLVSPIEGTFTPTTPPYAELLEKLSPGLKEESYRRIFVTAVNSGEILPIIISPDHVIKDVIESNPKITTASAEDDRLYGIYKFITRFNPAVDSRQVKKLFKELLCQYGLDPNKPIPEQMNNIGSIGYFPTGISTSGSLILEKIHYLPEELHLKTLQASSWKLVSEKARQGIAKTHLYSVGLSVGSMLLDTASRLGVKHFTLGDPSKNHPDAAERLIYYRPEYKGWGKTPTAVWELLRRNPYAIINAYYDGLTSKNGPQFFQYVTNPNQKPICAEEVDSWEGKVNSRKQPRLLLSGKGIATIMIGDVGVSDTIYTYDSPHSLPFNGRVAQLDSKGDPYGEYYAKEKGNMAALFASIGGTNHIPQDSALIPLLAAGVIGKEISTVPQAWGAVLNAGAAFYETLIAIAEERDVEITDIVGYSPRKSIFPHQS
jgi:hypothetical protein